MVFLVRFPTGFWILVIYTSAHIYQVVAHWAFPFLAQRVRRSGGYPNERFSADF